MQNVNGLSIPSASNHENGFVGVYTEVTVLSPLYLVL